MVEEEAKMIPMCVGYSSIMAKRFGLVEQLNPFDSGKKPIFEFKVLTTPHGLFITASSD